MNVAILLAELADQGITLSVVSDQLRAKPTAAVTPELVERMRACKAELMELLTDGDSPCPRCGSTDTGHAALWCWCYSCETKLGPSKYQVEFAVLPPDEFEADGWPIGSVDPDEVPVCPTAFYKRPGSRWRVIGTA